MLGFPWGGSVPCWLWFHLSAQPVSGTELSPRAGWDFPVPCRHVSLCDTKGKGEKESGRAAASYRRGNRGLEKLGQGMM